jgi:hypothetical protein
MQQDIYGRIRGKEKSNLASVGPESEKIKRSDVKRDR